MTSITWNQYRRDVGYDTFSQNPRFAYLNFQQNYFMNGVSWDGYIVRVNLNEDDPLHMAFNSASIEIKMEQDDRQGFHGPDIGLSLPEHVLVKYSEVIGSFHRGDHIRFNATIHSMGDSTHLHHLHVFALEKLEGHRDVEAHAHANGRYKVRIEPHDGKEHPELEQSGQREPRQYQADFEEELYDGDLVDSELG